jgi:hypothetical protein
LRRSKPLSARKSSSRSTAMADTRYRKRIFRFGLEYIQEPSDPGIRILKYAADLGQPNLFIPLSEEIAAPKHFRTRSTSVGLLATHSTPCIESEGSNVPLQPIGRGVLRSKVSLQ